MRDLNRLCLWCFHELNGTRVCPCCGHTIGDGPKKLFELPLGTILNGRYIIGGEIGMGGFGITYKAYDVTLDIVVAIKEFYPNAIVYRGKGSQQVHVFSEEQENLYQGRKARFINEAKTQANFSNEPEVATVYSWFEENGTAYIAMEYIEGLRVCDYLQQYGKMEVKDALSIEREVLEALQKLHKQGIIHRDVSPDNIFICEGNHIKLIDFGAAYLDSEDDSNMYEAVIKDGYSPPEQYRSEYTPKPTIDIYAAGALLYEMVTGVRPISAQDRLADVALQKPSSFGIKINPNIEKAIMQAMELQVDYRFQSVEEFLGVIREGKKTRKRYVNAKVTIIGLVAAFVLIVTTAIVAWQMYRADLMHYTPKEGTSIRIWLVLDDAVDVGKEGRNNIQKDLKAGFEEQYPTVNLYIDYIREDAYEQKLLETPDDKLPDIYCTDYMKSDRKLQQADLEPLVKKLDNVSYLFTDIYKQNYIKKTEIPTGFQLAVYYKNASQEPLEQTDYIGIKEVEKETGEKNCRWIDTVGSKDKVYEKMSNTLRPLNAVAGSLSVYKGVQDKLVSEKKEQLEILPIVEDGKLLCSFTNCYAVKESDDRNKEKTCMLFLYYLLGNSAQRELYLKQDYALPVNGRAFQEYMENLDTYNVKYITDNIEVIGTRNISTHISNQIQMDTRKYGVFKAYGEEQEGEKNEK